MGQIKVRNQPCDNEECSSSDGMQIYTDDSSYCFVCKKARREGYHSEEGASKSLSDKDVLDDTIEGKHGFSATTTEVIGDDLKMIKEIYEDYPVRGFKERSIFQPVSEHYDVRCTYDANGVINAFYFPERVVDGVPESYSRRQLPKQFRSYGPVSDEVFGLHLYSSGKRIIITEGHLDAMSIQSAYYKKYKRFYPVVSLGSSASLGNLVKHRDQLRKFDEVIFWPDYDEPGLKLIPDVARIIGYDKVKIVSCQEDDPSAVWMNQKDPAKLLSYVYDASPYTPSSVLTGDDIWDRLVEYNNRVSVPYPDFMEGINEKTRGMRQGEISLFVSGTGSGKSSLIREIGWHVLQTTPDKLGIVALEEGPAETARKMAGLALNKNPAKEEIKLDELKVGYDAVFGDDRVMVLDHQGSISDGSVMDHLEFMCLSGCKYLIVDHITILASEGAGKLTGNEAVDKVMNDLLSLVKKHDVWIGLISHLRKTGDGPSFEEGKIPTMDDIKGSGSIKQISMDVIAFARDMGNEDVEVRNRIKTKVLKCRFTGLTGPSGDLMYDYNTGRINAAAAEFKKEETTTKTADGFMKV